MPLYCKINNTSITLTLIWDFKDSSIFEAEFINSIYIKQFIRFKMRFPFLTATNQGHTRPHWRLHNCASFMVYDKLISRSIFHAVNVYLIKYTTGKQHWLTLSVTMKVQSNQCINSDGHVIIDNQFLSK